MGAPRRGFLKSLATVPLLPATLRGQAASPAPSPSPPPAPAASTDGPPSPVAEALAEAVRHRYGVQLAAGDLEEIKKAIDGNLRAAERLKALKLGNADEPVTRFEALPPGANPGPSSRRAPVPPRRPPARPAGEGA